MSEQNTPPKKDNKGFLFINENKNKATQPDQTGRITIDGKDYRISAWDSTAAGGKKYLSLAITPYFPPTNNQNNNQNSNQNNNNNARNSNSNSGNNSNSNNYGNKKNFTAAPISNDFDLDLDQILNQSDDDTFN